MRTKKISKSQFILDCVNKSLEISNDTRRFESFDELKRYVDNYNGIWCDSIIFKTSSQVDELRDYFIEHYYDMMPKRISKRIAIDSWSYYYLCFGPSVEYENNSTQGNKLE